MNVQPVVPITLNAEWNVISRTIVPLISQTDVVGNSSESGLGDVATAPVLLAQGAHGQRLDMGRRTRIPIADGDRRLSSGRNSG